MGNNLTFHLFGDCWVEDPQECLNDDEFAEFSKYLPLIQELDHTWKNRPRSCWNSETAFAELVEKETATWKQLGAERSPQYLLAPSGSIDSSLACHLFNPTFWVEDSENRVTDDPTSPTMYLIHSSGFSSKDCLIFDEICRRDETRDVLWFYNEDLYRHHRDFVCNLRENMSAVVEICWGKDVWNIMEKTNPRLARFPLWGSFKDVRLWLELDGQSLKRFIIHVYHPQFFCRIGQEKLRKSTSEFREKYGKPQDLALLMAAQFVGLQDRINSQFFSTDLKLGRYPRLKGDQNHRRENHLQSARGSFRVAFPEKYREFELKEAQKAMEQRVFQALETERHVSATSFESMTPMVTLPPLEVSVEEQLFRLRARDAELRRVVASFNEMFEDVSPICVAETCTDEGFEYLEPELSEFEDIPSQLSNWLVSQNGLKIDDKPLSNRDMLKTTFNLLRHKQKTSFNLEHVPIAYLALTVALRYIDKITQPKSEFHKNNTIPGNPGQVIRRKCGSCKRGVLNDAFPHFSAELPRHYAADVLWAAPSDRNGCGRPDCRGQPALIPVDPRQNYTRVQTRSIERSSRAHNVPSWSDPFCRMGEDLRECAATVLVRCRDCKHEQTHLTPRWTIHHPPRYLLPRLKCQGCDRKDAYWDAVDKISTVIESCLRSILEGFKGVRCNLAEFPKIPEIIFARAQFKTRFKGLKKVKEARGDLGDSVEKTKDGTGNQDPGFTRKRKSVA